jgi:hypothetical protein
MAGTLLNGEANSPVLGAHTAASAETERAAGVSRVAHLHGERGAAAGWEGEGEQRLPEEAGSRGRRNRVRVEGAARARGRGVCG